MTNPFLNTTIGIIGGGQLGKMMAQSAKRQGYRVIVLDPQPDCPTSQVCDQQIVAGYDEPQALRQLAEQCDVITYEFENVDCDTIAQTLSPTLFPQGIRTLQVSQNRLAEKAFLTEQQIPVGAFQAVRSVQDLANAIEKIGYPAVLKTTRFGYDGKGQVVLKSEADLDKARQLAENQECVLEAWVHFEKEVSIMIGRNLNGDCSIFPVSENIHLNNILHLSIVPARISPSLAEKVQACAEKIANALNLVGMLGVEFFVTENEVYVNEIAPRPHNSGHYSIEACNFSQFDTAIAAVLNLPMPKIRLNSPVVMVNVLGQHQQAVYAEKARQPQWHFHDYGKHESKHNRKMGHITILGEIETSLNAITQTQIW